MKKHKSDMRFFVASLMALLLTLGLFLFAISKSDLAMAQEKEKEKAKPSKAEGEIKNIHKSLEKVKVDLAKEMKYGCCIKPSCDFCALAVAMCPCGMNAAKSMPVCPECKAGWVSGQGQIPNLKAEDIKVAPDDMLKMMMQKRAMMKG